MFVTNKCKDLIKDFNWRGEIYCRIHVSHQSLKAITVFQIYMLCISVADISFVFHWYNALLSLWIRIWSVNNIYGKKIRLNKNNWLILFLNIRDVASRKWNIRYVSIVIIMHCINETQKKYPQQIYNKPIIFVKSNFFSIYIVYSYKRFQHTNVFEVNRIKIVSFTTYVLSHCAI
jgi:hypothetical protein